MAYVAIADRDHEQHAHDPDTFITKYVWSQDHKVIAIQYGGLAILMGVIALALSPNFSSCRQNEAKIPIQKKQNAATGHIPTPAKFAITGLQS
jgi:hypothetical protein